MQTIAQGPGNLNLPTRKVSFKCNGAVAKGDVVGLFGTTGYTIDQCNTTTILPIGVAAETGADGDWIDVVVAGFCDYVTNDGTDVVAYDFLVGGAGVAIPKTLVEAETDAAHVGWQNQIFGQSLGAETGTTCTQVVIYNRFGF